MYSGESAASFNFQHVITFGEIKFQYILWLQCLQFLNKSCLARHLLFFSLHTYMIGHYNPSVKIIDLVSHTIYVVCVNFIHKLRDLQFKVDSERQI